MTNGELLLDTDLHGVTLASRDRHFDRVPGLRRVPCLN